MIKSSLKLFLCIWFLGQASFADPLRMITITGTGTVAVAPDMAMVTLGVRSQAETAGMALTDNSTQMAAVFSALKAAQIKARDIQTSQLNLNPVWGRSADNAGRKIDGYEASNQVTVRVRQLDSLGTVLDQLATAGVNSIQSVSFSVDKPKPHLDDARLQAVRDAQDKADQYANAAGVKLGPIQSIREAGVASPRPMARMGAQAMSADVPIAGGEVGLSAQVTIEFLIE